MAIKGLTDKQAAFPSLGVLRKGEKKVQDNAPGKDLTYFRFVSDDNLANEMFIEAYPNEEALRNINVFLPFRTAKENFDAWLEKWVAGGLIYRSDGETVVLWRNEKGQFSTEPKPDPRPEIGEDGKRADGSSQVGRMTVIIPELGRFATVTVLTTSKWDIMNLDRQLRSYEALEGDLRGIPFVLKRTLQYISTPMKGGKRARRQKWLLSIETLPRYTIAKIADMERKALPAGAEIIDSNDYTIHQELPANIFDPFIEDESETAAQSPAANGQATTAEPAQAEAKPAKSKLIRPMTPEQVKAAAEVKSARFAGKPGEKQADYAFSSLNSACGKDDLKRHTVTLFLFGKESSKDLTGGECSFLIDWIGAKQENNYTPDENAMREIEAIITEWQRESGQTDMFETEQTEEIAF